MESFLVQQAMTTGQVLLSLSQAAAWKLEKRSSEAWFEVWGFPICCSQSEKWSFQPIKISIDIAREHLLSSTHRSYSTPDLSSSKKRYSGGLTLQQNMTTNLGWPSRIWRYDPGLFDLICFAYLTDLQNIRIPHPHILQLIQMGGYVRT